MKLQGGFNLNECSYREDSISWSVVKGRIQYHGLYLHGGFKIKELQGGFNIKELHGGFNIKEIQEGFNIMECGTGRIQYQEIT